MAEYVASSTTATASSSGGVLVGSTLSLDDHQRIVQRPRQTPSIFTTNPNPTRIPCLQPLQLLGLSLQTASKLIAASLTVEGVALVVMGAFLIVYQQRDKTEILSKRPKHVDYDKLITPLEAQLFIGAFSMTRGILYTSLSLFLGISASRANLYACRCWVFVHGTLLAFSWVATIVGIVLYFSSWRLKLALLLPMLPCLVEMYGMYVAWAFAKELSAAAAAHRKIQNDAHGRFPVPYSRGSEMMEILPLGLEMNASSQSYQLKQVDEDRTRGWPGGSPAESKKAGNGVSGGGAATDKTAGESPANKNEGTGTSGAVGKTPGESPVNKNEGTGASGAAGKTAAGPVNKVGEPPGEGGGGGGGNKTTIGRGGASSFSGEEDEETASARGQRKKNLKSSGRSLRKSRSRIN